MHSRAVSRYSKSYLHTITRKRARARYSWLYTSVTGARKCLAGNCKVHVNCLAYFVNSAVLRSNRNLSESRRITRNKKVSRWISSRALFCSKREENKRESFAHRAATRHRLQKCMYKLLSYKAGEAISKQVVTSATFRYDSLILESFFFLFFLKIRTIHVAFE